MDVTANNISWPLTSVETNPLHQNLQNPLPRIEPAAKGIDCRGFGELQTKVLEIAEGSIKKTCMSQMKIFVTEKDSNQKNVTTCHKWKFFQLIE